MKIRPIMPFIVGFGVALILHFTVHWWGFWLIFPWIGGWVSVGSLLSINRKGLAKDLGRRIAILAVSPIFLIFLGIIQHENLQLEQTVFYLYVGFFSRVLIHYAIAKVLGPLIWGRGFCGWACWTAALLEWLPIKENKPIPPKLNLFRIPVFLTSIMIPYLFIQSGYDFPKRMLIESAGKYDQFIWFLVGNGTYYLVAVILAFAFRKKRAFCKIACPVSLVMKVTSRFSAVKIQTSGIECIECGKCNRNCPMDVDVQKYISEGRRVCSTECILCGICRHACPVGAIK